MVWFKVIPWKTIAVIVLMGLMWGHGFITGVDNQKDKQAVIDARNAEAEAVRLQDAINDALKRSQQSFEVERKQLAKEEKVRTITKTIVRTIRDEKPDADCDLSNGWVQRHNEAAANSIPAPPGVDHETPAGVTADQALEQVAENYGSCHEIRAVALSCQEWVLLQYNGSQEDSDARIE